MHTCTCRVNGFEFCLFSVYFQVSRHKKDPDRLFQQKQFIAWWIDKHWQKSPDEPIVVLFDMQGAGISNMVMLRRPHIISCFTRTFIIAMTPMVYYAVQPRLIFLLFVTQRRYSWRSFDTETFIHKLAWFNFTGSGFSAVSNQLLCYILSCLAR